jgi:hypothetical protein
MPRKCSPLSQIRRGQKMPGPLLLVYFMGARVQNLHTSLSISMQCCLSTCFDTSLHVEIVIKYFSVSEPHSGFLYLSPGPHSARLHVHHSLYPINFCKAFKGKYHFLKGLRHEIKIKCFEKRQV